MNKRKKGESGYIEYRLLVQAIKVMIGALIIGALLVVGNLRTGGNRNNYFTLAAIVLVLPTARTVVNMCMFWKHRGISDKKSYMELSENCGNVFLLSDMIATIKEKIYGIDFAIVTDSGICCYSTARKLSQKDACDQIEKFVRSCGYDVTVTMLKDYDKFLNRVRSASGMVFDIERAEGVRHAFLLMCL